MKTKLCNCKRASHELPVYDNLSVTPSQMLELALDGTPVSAQNLGMSFDDGYSQLDFVPPLEHQRGVDISDMWSASKEFKSKVRKAKDAGKMVPVSE